MEEPKAGSFVHIEFASTDPERTRKFLEDVFEWKFESMPELAYHTYSTPSGPGGGLMKPMEGQPPGVLSYILSQDVEQDIRKIEGAGGFVLQPKHEIPGVGWFAVFREPTGITLALFQSMRNDRGPTARATGGSSRKARPSRPRGSRKARPARGGRKARGKKR
jgi:uncharacterized protein